MHAASSHVQTLFFRAILKMSYHALFVCNACTWWRGGWAPINHFLLLPLFSLFLLPNYKSVIWFFFNFILILLISIFFIIFWLIFFFNFSHCHLVSFNFYIKFSPHSCDCCFFSLFSNWILSSISSSNIWFQIIFMSNLILILLIIISLLLDIVYCIFFNFIPQYFDDL